MIDWFTTVGIVVALLASAICVIDSLRGKPARDLTVISSLVVEGYLILLTLSLIVGLFFGNTPKGSALEFWSYLITALLIVPLVTFWAIRDQSRWSNGAMGISAIVIAVMLVRMSLIWTGV
jgi:hypothetical protein